MIRKHTLNRSWVWDVVIMVFIVLGGVFSRTVTHAQGSDDAYQEALKRIQAAQETGATELSLRQLGLVELPPEIGQLTNLQKIDLIHNHLSSLPPEITQLTSLKRLYLVGNPLEDPPSDVVEQGTTVILAYLREQLDEAGSE